MGLGHPDRMMRPPTIPEWPAEDPRLTAVALRRELLAIGYTDRALAALVEAGILARPRRGAYVDGPTFDALDPPEKYVVVVRAVMKQAMAEVVASHVSAVPVWDAPTWGLDLSRVHLTRTDGRAGRTEAGVQQHCGRLLPEDVVTRNGIRTTSGTRTALDLTTVAGVEPSLVVVNHLLHTGATTVDALRTRYTASAGSMEHWPNSLTTDLVLRLARAEMESVGESRSWHLFFVHSIPMPVCQYVVRGRSGEVVARLDFAWPDRKVWLEFDGRIKYQRLLRPGESVTDVVLREKARESLIAQLTGWRCIRITWADLEHPERTAAMIKRELDRAAA